MMIWSEVRITVPTVYPQDEELDGLEEDEDQVGGKHFHTL